jgi:hypothetical protein
MPLHLLHLQLQPPKHHGEEEHHLSRHMQPACSSDLSRAGMSLNPTRGNQNLNLLYKEGTWPPRPCSLSTDALPKEGNRGMGRRWTLKGLSGWRGSSN